MSNPAGSLDFSMLWELSDVVVVVEDDRFYVHRCILGMWSEVFSTMFTSQFKEKTAEEVPLPGEKSAEIKEMLLVIYPTSAKPIGESNYTFLLDLAKEYMMAKITEKCESYLVGRLGSAESCIGACVCGNWRQYVKKGNCLWLLVIAQTYGLDRLEWHASREQSVSNSRSLRKTKTSAKSLLLTIGRLLRVCYNNV